MVLFHRNNAVNGNYGFFRNSHNFFTGDRKKGIFLSPFSLLTGDFPKNMGGFRKMPLRACYPPFPALRGKKKAARPFDRAAPKLKLTAYQTVFELLNYGGMYHRPHWRQEKIVWYEKKIRLSGVTLFRAFGVCPPHLRITLLRASLPSPVVATPCVA